MRLHSFIPAVIFVGFVGATGALGSSSLCDALQPNLVHNCGFEMGTFADWTLSGNLQGGFNGNYYGVGSDPLNPGNQPPFIPYPPGVDSGNYAAYLGVQQTPITLTQSLNTPVGFYYIVTFFLEQNGPLVGVHYFNNFSVSFGDIVLVSESNVPNTSGYLGYSFVRAVDSPVSNLTFTFQNDDDYFLLDDIFVQRASPTPEPASLGLAALALGLVIVRHASRRVSTRQTRVSAPR